MKKFITLILLLSITISGCGIDDTPASESAPVNSVGSSSESSQPNITVIPYDIDLSREFQPFKNEPSKDSLHIINTGYTDKKIYVNDQTSGYNNLKVIDTENNTMTTICKKLIVVIPMTVAMDISHMDTNLYPHGIMSILYIKILPVMKITHLPKLPIITEWIPMGKIENYYILTMVTLLIFTVMFFNVATSSTSTADQQEHLTAFCLV